MAIVKYWHPAEDEGIFPSGTRGLDDGDFWGSTLCGAVAIAVAGSALLTGCTTTQSSERQFTQDNQEVVSALLPAVPNEDYWINPIFPQQNLEYQPLPYDPDTNDVPAGALVNLPIDEIYWINRVPPVPSSMFVVLPFEDDSNLTVTPVVNNLDEDYWLNKVRPVVASNYIKTPYLPDTQDIVLPQPIVFPSSLVIAASATQFFVSSGAVPVWSVSGGSITAGSGNGATFTASATPGSYTVTATVGGSVINVPVTVVSTPANPTIRFDSPLQTMDGFGAANVFEAQLTSTLLNDLFDQQLGIGLSIFRIGITSPDKGTGTFFEDSDLGTNNTMLDAQAALAKGVKYILAAPWSPSAAYKTTGNITTGSLLAAHYADWATYLGQAVDSAASQGVPITHLSLQNEPDFDTGGAYEGCTYTAATYRDFLKIAGPIIAARNPAPLLCGPEPGQWVNLWTGTDYMDALLADPVATQYLNLIVTHQYGTPIGTVTLPNTYDKRIWETETSDFNAFDGSMNQGLSVASHIHDAIFTGLASAWLHWWMNGRPDNEGLYDPTQTTPAKRLFVLGNYSKWIRPGYQRVNIIGTLPTNVTATAYIDPVSNKVVVVVTNNQPSSQSISISLAGMSKLPSAMAPYETTGSTIGSIGTAGNLGALSNLALSSGTFSTTLSGNSVTTFVSFAPDEDYWINPIAPVVSSLNIQLPLIDDSNLVVTPPAPIVEELYWISPFLSQSTIKVSQPWDVEETPAATLFGQPDEDYWINTVKPVSSSIYQKLPIGDVEEIPAATLFGQMDEDLWVNPVAPTQLVISQKLPLGDVEEIPAGLLFGQFEEDSWKNSVSSVIVSNYYKLPYGFDQDELTSPPGQPDEDFWVNSVTPVQSSMFVRLPIGDPEELLVRVVAANGQPDEDFWITKPAPVQATQYIQLPYLPDPEEIPAITLTGQMDEDYWKNPIAPVIFNTFQVLPIVEEIPAGTLFGQYDEDFWVSNLKPTPATVFQRLPVGDVEELPAGNLFGQYDEDFWISGVLPVAASLAQVLPFVDKDELSFGTVSSIIEEITWINSVSPVQNLMAIALPLSSQDELPIVSISAIVEEAYWVPLVGQTFKTVISSSLPSDTEILPTPSVIDEDYWCNPTTPAKIVISQKLPLGESLADIVPTGALDEVNIVRSFNSGFNPGFVFFN